MTISRHNFIAAALLAVSMLGSDAARTLASMQTAKPNK